MSNAIIRRKTMKKYNESQITQIELSIEVMMYGHAFACVAQEGTSVIVSNVHGPDGYEGESSEHTYTNSSISQVVSELTQAISTASEHKQLEESEEDSLIDVSASDGATVWTLVISETENEVLTVEGYNRESDFLQLVMQILFKHYKEFDEIQSFTGEL